MNMQQIYFSVMLFFTSIVWLKLVFDVLYAEKNSLLTCRLTNSLLLCLIQVSYADCCEIVAACKSAGVILAVCHVLRYTPQACKIAELIQSGCIGDVVNIQHTEPVSSVGDFQLMWHYSYLLICSVILWFVLSCVLSFYLFILSFIIIVIIFNCRALLQTEHTL